MTFRHWAQIAISGKLLDKSDLVGSAPRFLYFWAAIGIGLMVMLVSASAAESRDPRDGRGPFFDGDWTPIKVQRHHAPKKYLAPAQRRAARNRASR